MFSFENNNTNKYLVYKLEVNEKIDHTSVGMISNNKIENICSGEYLKSNNEETVRFDISSKVPSFQMFSKTLNKDLVVRLLDSICNAVINAKEYMLDLNQIVLDLNYVFMNLLTGEFDFICLPLSNMKENDIIGFIRNIVVNATFNQNEDNRYVTAIIGYVNNEKKFSLETLQKLVVSIKENKLPNVPVNQQNVHRNNVPLQQNVQKNNVPLQQNVQKNNIPLQQNVQKNNIPLQQNVQRNNVPLQQNVQKNNVPIQQNVQKNNVPLQQNVQKNNVPLQQNVQKNNIPVQRNLNNGMPAIQPMPPMQVKPGKEKKKKSLFGFKRHHKENKNLNNPNQQSNFDYSGSQNQYNPNMQMQDVPKKKKSKKASKKKNQQVVPPMQSPVQPIQNNVPPMQKPAQPMQNNVPPMQRPAQPIQNNASPMQRPAQPIKGNVPTVANNVAIPVQNMSNNPTTEIDYGETTVLGGNNVYGETTVLGEESFQNEITPYLIRIKNDEKIRINKPIFRIGKEKSFVDYFIGDNTYISRGHANIICRDGHCYIVDNNSRNHTYVNGQMIASGKEVELKNGDTVKLANEAFEFKVF